MTSDISTEFLTYSADKLQQQTGRITDCLAKLTTEQLWARGSQNENAVGNLVLHLCGNVRQWIVAGVGGALDSRQRDVEFATRDAVSSTELAERLGGTIGEAVAVIQKVTAERLTERVVVQHYDVSVLSAIYHVVEHFSGHAGQIIFATKLLTGSDLEFHSHLRTTAAHSEKMP